VASLKIDDALRQLQDVLAQLPVKVDPLSFFGGGGSGRGGHFSDKRLEDSKWALYGRTSWLGKLGIELVAGRFVDLAQQGLSVKPIEVEGERRGVELSGGQLTQTLYLGRIQDVVLIANDVTLLNAAHALRKTRGQDSFLQSAKYAGQHHAHGAGRRSARALLQPALAGREAGSCPGPGPIEFARGGRRAGRQAVPAGRAARADRHARLRARAQPGFPRPSCPATR